MHETNSVSTYVLMFAIKVKHLKIWFAIWVCVVNELSLLFLFFWFFKVSFKESKYFFFICEKGSIFPSRLNIVVENGFCEFSDDEYHSSMPWIVIKKKIKYSIESQFLCTHDWLDKQNHVWKYRFSFEFHFVLIKRIFFFHE